MMAASLTLSIFEIILLFFGAIILGITIHFFIASRKSLNESAEELGMTTRSPKDEWKLRYLNDMDHKEKEMLSLKERLQEAEANSNIYTMEAEEVNRQNKLLKTELENVRKQTSDSNERVAIVSSDVSSEGTAEVEELRKENRVLKAELEYALELAAENSGTNHTIGDAAIASANAATASVSSAMSNHSSEELEELREKVEYLEYQLENARKSTGNVAVAVPQQHRPDYLEQLHQAQKGLLEHNQKITQLLGNIDIIKEKEEEQREVRRANEELYAKLDTMKEQLSDKEREIHSIKEKELLTTEMTSMLDNAYREFNTLQEKMQHMESQLTSAKKTNMELEDLKEAYAKAMRDLEEQRQKTHRFQTDMHEMQSILSDAEDNLRETSFQKQQLQKRVAYLEELNNDLQVVSDANKKLESQLRKVGELESKLNVVSAERDQLMRHMDK